MPRDSRKVIKRTPEPDPVQLTLVSKFINCTLRRGSSRRREAVYHALS
jgi:hypothetical protein